MKVKAEKISEISIDCKESVLFALKQMDKTERKLLIVTQNNQFMSLLSIGDIQRALINNVDISSAVSAILRDKDKISVSHENDDIKKRIENIIKHRTEFMPIISSAGDVIDVIFWEDVVDKDEKRIRGNVSIPVVIMAGGKGTRLKPLTNVLPKPLIPIGEKTILEEILTRFSEVGCHKFYLSVNYHAEMIKHYFKTIKKTTFNLEYFEEDNPLGTAGSMYLLKNKIDSTFFVSNCDILIDQDLEDIYNYHKNNKNTITIVSALKHYQIPYGTIETCNHGILSSLEEKPELTFQINTGVYILEPEVLQEIPDNTFMHITELIENIQKKGKQVGVFPISESAWEDIGEWNEYSKYIER